MTEHGKVSVDTDTVRANLREHLEHTVPDDELPAIIEETLYRFLSACNDIAQHIRRPHRLELEIPAYVLDGIKIVMIMPVYLAPIKSQKEEDGYG